MPKARLAGADRRFGMVPNMLRVLAANPIRCSAAVHATSSSARRRARRLGATCCSEQIALTVADGRTAAMRLPSALATVRQLGKTSARCLVGAMDIRGRPRGHDRPSEAARMSAAPRAFVIASLVARLKAGCRLDD